MIRLNSTPLLEQIAGRFKVGYVLIDKTVAQVGSQEFKKLLKQLEIASKTSSKDEFQSLADAGIKLAKPTTSVIKKSKLFWTRFQFLVSKLTGRLKRFVKREHKIDTHSAANRYRKVEKFREAFADLHQIAKEGWTEETEKSLAKAFHKIELYRQESEKFFKENPDQWPTMDTPVMLAFQEAYYPTPSLRPGLALLLKEWDIKVLKSLGLDPLQHLSRIPETDALANYANAETFLKTHVFPFANKPFTSFIDEVGSCFDSISVSEQLENEKRKLPQDASLLEHLASEWHKKWPFDNPNS